MKINQKKKPKKKLTMFLRHALPLKLLSHLLSKVSLVMICSEDMHVTLNHTELGVELKKN